MLCVFGTLQIVPPFVQWAIDLYPFAEKAFILDTKGYLSFPRKILTTADRTRRPVAPRGDLAVRVRVRRARARACAVEVRAGLGRARAHRLLHRVHVRALLAAHPAMFYRVKMNLSGKAKTAFSPVVEPPRPGLEALPAGGRTLGPPGPLARGAHVVGQEVVWRVKVETVV